MATTTTQTVETSLKTRISPYFVIGQIEATANAMGMTPDKKIAWIKEALQEWDQANKEHRILMAMDGN